MKIRNLKNSTTALIAVILLAKLVGLLRDIVLAKHYGTSAVSDAYLMAVSVPTLIFYFIGHSLSTAYLPMFNQVRQKNGQQKALDYSNNLACISFLFVTVLVAALVAFTKPILELFAPGFDDETMALTVRLVRISAASLYFMTMVSIWTGYLQANKNFVIPGSVSLARNAVLITSIIISAKYGVIYLGFGLLLAYIAECLLLLPFAWRAQYRPRLVLRFREDEVRETLYLVLPIIIGMCVSQVNKIVDRALASTMLTGGVSALSYASVINTAVQEILVTGVITVLFASCSELVVQGRHEEVKKKLSTTVDMLLFLLLPAAIGIVLLAREVVTGILCRGNFDAESVYLTSGALRFYSCGIVFVAVRDTLIKLFYAYKDTKTATVTSVCAIVLNIGLNFLLSHFLGINGLALATSLSAAAQCVALYLLLRRKIGDFGTKASALLVLKSLLCCAVMAALLIVLKRLSVFAALPVLISLILTVLIGAASYLLLARLLRIAPIMDAIAMLRKRCKMSRLSE